MTATYPARQPTGNRKRDVQNPLWKEAEDRVLAWLRASGQQVSDIRGQKTYYDFTLDNLWTLDVKVDQYAHTTGRVAWELVVEHNGRLREGWGRNEGLDYVAYVFPGSWEVLLVERAKVSLLTTRLEQGLTSRPPGQYDSFEKRGEDGRNGIGVLIGLPLLREQGCVVREGSI